MLQYSKYLSCEECFYLLVITVHQTYVFRSYESVIDIAFFLRFRYGFSIVECKFGPVSDSKLKGPSSAPDAYVKWLYRAQSSVRCFVMLFSYSTLNETCYV